MIIRSRFTGRMLVRKENGNWFGYGLNSNNEIIGCVVIAPNSCETEYSVYEFVKSKICSSVVIEELK